MGFFSPKQFLKHFQAGTIMQALKGLIKLTPHKVCFLRFQLAIFLEEMYYELGLVEALDIQQNTLRNFMVSNKYWWIGVQSQNLCMRPDRKVVNFGVLGAYLITISCTVLETGLKPVVFIWNKNKARILNFYFKIELLDKFRAYQFSNH